MRKFGFLVLTIALLATDVAAEETRPILSAGYSLALSGDIPPKGVYVSIAARTRVPLEAKVSYQRGRRNSLFDLGWEKSPLHEVFSAGLGPWFSKQYRNKRSFVHAMLGMRRDWLDAYHQDTFTTAAGVGVDFLLGRGIALRIGGDYEVALRRGENYRAVRLAFGIAR